ncbi:MULTISPECIES: ABC transporter ATP-binding protein [Janibacter]|uniref:ABC transporter n=1 Tax=Janibacter hoylei PVAS-1 TaxID=1210046 RepID=K1E0Q5_9MICO|nr:ATP-binding cassette domain-containing protein [Janibacter hoylei]EKA62445.1 ABC transporter [Janibacter hoylei PVAS-1]MCT1618254.1 ATP-binding cassette domain-containing protein [Janibacter hoylei]MCT2293693.1 ATP-binding cassette domain-containing protein [Janibacter hoylei]RWU83068.1 ABC transporter ATP-binding protein [Janibacter hoylei PVAS-1]
MDTTPQTITVEGLTRRFGDFTAVDHIGFTVPQGKMTGFVGGNGAGKTTTMRMIMGVLSITEGRVLWGDRPITAADQRSIGYMPEERGLYPKQKVADQLIYLGQLRGMTAKASRESVMTLLERLGLEERTEDTVESLSLGNQQRVQIAAALMIEPAALILDEPFSGLDPDAVDSMADLLREHTARGVPVLFSSHQLDLVDRLCDELVILAKGQVRASGTPTDLRGGAPRRHRLVAARDAGWVRDLPGIAAVDVDGPVAVLDLSADSEAERQRLLGEVLAEGLRRGGVTELSPIIPPLSEVYREVTA